MTNRYHMSPPDYGPGTVTWLMIAILAVVAAAWNGTNETWTLPYEVLPV